MQSVSTATPASRLRGLATVAATLLVVVGEFLLLSSVYHRGDDLQTQRVVQAELAGRLTGVSGDDAVRAAGRGLDRLAEADVAPAHLAALAAARDALADTPADAERLATLRQENRLLGEQLRARRATVDGQADALYAGLIAFVSVGWFVWFRRLVRRHRAMQRALTTQEALAVNERRLLALVQHGSDVVMVLAHDGRASFVGPSVREVLGVEPQDVVGRPMADLLHEDDVPFLQEMITHLRPGAEGQVEFRMRHADGRALVVDGVLTNLLDEPAVAGFVLTARDVTERHALEEQLSYQAFHDSLTGLANRQLFADRLAHALARRHESRQPLVVLFCDLQDFKNVNDNHGHGFGDEVLAALGNRLRDGLRAGDTAARLGGDEFAVLMEDADLTEARVIADRLRRRLSQPCTVGEAEVVVQVSIGMAEAVPGESGPEEVLRNADVAMYWAKDQGGSAIAVYDADRHARAIEELSLRTELEVAIETDQLVLHFQPTVDLARQRITGFEALVRWEHPDRGLLSPTVFVPVAEQTGLIVPLGSWVLREACRTAMTFGSRAEDPTMAVNVAAEQLSRDDFVDEVVAVLRETGLSPHRLILELTESAVLQDFHAVAPRLAALRACGVRIAIDDFGTGYSSLAYLTRLPVDVLKVDKSFIDQVASESHGSAVTAAILSMSGSMNLTTVAEGVEHRAQADWLRRAGCQIGQGYLWSRPVAVGEARALLECSGLGPEEARREPSRRPAGPAMQTTPALPRVRNSV